MCKHTNKILQKLDFSEDIRLLSNSSISRNNAMVVIYLKLINFKINEASNELHLKVHCDQDVISARCRCIL